MTVTQTFRLSRNNQFRRALGKLQELTRIGMPSLQFSAVDDLRLRMIKILAFLSFWGTRISQRGGISRTRIRLLQNFLLLCDQTCHGRRDDSFRDWQWLGQDGITEDNGHGLADGMPTLGICTVETVGQPLPIALLCVSRLDRLTF